MLSSFNLRGISRRTPVVAVTGGVFCAAVFAASAAIPDQPVGDTVGIIEGEAISVTGPMSMDATRGQVRTMLRSGSDIRVKSGQARIDLVEGGQVTICGPAHLSVLKSGGALTMALESGTIHARIEREPVMTVYTAQIQARPVAIEDGPQDILVGFETQGAMCVRANRGAVRIEQQLTNSSVLVPQGGNVLLTNGQLDSLRNGGGHCSCDLEVARAFPAPSPVADAPVRVENAGKTAAAPEPAASPAPAVAQAKKPSEKDETVYQVFMPPLRFDAHAKTQPEPDPRLIVLVRRVRVRPTLIYHGRVEGDAVATAVVTPPQPPAGPPSAPKAAAPASDSVVDRVRTFFRRLWSRNS